LNSDELETLPGLAFGFEAQLNGLSNLLDHFIQGSRLGVATGKLWDRGDVVTFSITFDNDVELPLQW